ncbi:MAG: hypothetical protein M1835_004547 [Candelina submexicana]|nr:MAG: hypothetical protein M1835_004547 [Candelina submexicana]
MSFESRIGIIIAASVLVAAGVAVYENPQVRQWMDQSRRKIAIALHSLGNDVQPPSMDEDDEEERRRQRVELMYWNMKRDEQRRKRKQREALKTSFDDMVTKEGNLKEVDTTHSTAREAQEGEYGLRRRNDRHKEDDGGAVHPNPFADQNESQVLFDRSLVDVKNEEKENPSRSSTATLPAEHEIFPTQPESPIRTAPITQPPQGQLVNLTSDAESSRNLFQAPSNYWSVNEWAESTSPSFYEASVGSENHTEPERPSVRGSAAPSLTGSVEDIGADSSVDGGEGRYMDILSETGISTPGSWTEVGSEVSEGDHGP